MKTLLFFLFPITLAAQQVPLRGVVTVFNSKFETGKTEYVANAQVEEDFGRAPATTTNADGTFKLILVGIKEKSSFNLKILKPTYEVVNSDQLRAVAGQRDAVHIFMAPRGKIAENKRKYYKIGKTASEESLNNKIAAKQKEVLLLRANQVANQQQINTLEKDIADLYQRYNTIDQNARELAERFSVVNLDDASDLYQRAFRHFQNGFIDSALIVLDKVNWVSRIDSILAEEAHLFALKNIIAFNDSVLTRQRDSIAVAIRVKIQSHLGLRQYREALRTSEWLPQLYAQYPTALSESYRQAAWLGLLAQEYSSTKLYVQIGLEMNGGNDPMLQRYQAYALFFTGDMESSRHLFQTLLNAPPGPSAFREIAQSDLKVMENAGLSATDLSALRKLLE